MTSEVPEGFSVTNVLKTLGYLGVVALAGYGVIAMIDDYKRIACIVERRKMALSKPEVTPNPVAEVKQEKLEVIKEEDEAEEKEADEEEQEQEQEQEPNDQEHKESILKFKVNQFLDRIDEITSRASSKPSC